MVTLRIYLLGPFKLEANGVPVTGFATQKAELLLAYLVATAPKAHSRESLATLFWPRSTPSAARYNLRYALWSVRNALRNAGLSPERHLKTDPETCQFAPASDHWCDADAFTEKSEIVETSEVFEDLAGPAQPTISHLQDAVALCRGEFLEGARVPGCPLLQEWLTFERERWRHRYLEALDRLVQALIARRDHDEAVAYSRDILRIDPLRERAHRQLMQLYWLTGQRTMALRQYETCRQLLQKELGIQPLAVTQDLYHHIREEEPPPDEPGTLSFPPPMSPLRRFVGREPALTLLRNCFAEAPSGRGRLVLVAGEAGIGKTRLLQEFARQVGNRAGLICWGNCFPGELGLPYQPLIEALRSAIGQLDPVKLKGLPAIWLHEVSRLVPELAEHIPPLTAVPPLPPEQEKNRLYEGIAQFLIHTGAFSATQEGGAVYQPSSHRYARRLPQPLILFLDNLQWADESTFQLLGFLVRRIAPAGTLFVGAFRPEDTLADHPLVRLERTLSREGLLARMELSALSESDVVTMVISQTERDARTEELARWLYRESEGNPFFITEMVQALLDGGLLRQGPQGTWRLSPGLMARIGAGIPIPQTIRDVILSRIHELEPETRDVLALAAVLGRHFRYNVLRQASGLPEARLLDCLRAMLDRRLIREQETGRYEFTHDKIQQTVYDVTPEAFRAYRHRQAGTALEHLYAENPTPVIGELARHFRRGGEEQKAFTYLVQAGDRAWALYAHQEAIRHYQRAVDLGWRLPQVSPATLAAVHEKMSDVESLIGDYSAAMSSCERALDLAGDAAVPLTSAVLWRKVGRLRERQGDYEGALQDFERASRALPPGRSPTARLEHARLGRERAWVYMRQGHYDQARRRLRAAIDMIESDPGSEARRALGRLWTVLGIVDWYQSDYAAAAAELEQGLRIKEAIADDYGIGQSYNNLGLVYRSLGFYEKSLSYHNRGLALLRKIGDVAGQASCLHNIGLVHHNRGDYQAAIDCYQQSRELFEQIGFTTGLPAVYNDLGEAYLGLGDEQQALRDLEKGLRIAEEAGSRIALSALHSALAAARRRMGEHPPALEHARQALHLAEETDVGYDRAVAHRILGEVLATTQPDEARAHLQRSLQIAESLGERTELARSRRAYGQFLCAQGDRRGVRYLQQARDLFAELGARAELEKTEALLKNVEHDR